MADPITTPFTCTLNQQSVFTRFPNPDFIVSAFAEVEPLFCQIGIDRKGIPGIIIEFNLDGSIRDDNGSAHFMKISSMPIPFNSSHIKADRFTELCKDPRFTAYLKAIIAKALIDHFLVNRILTRESIMASNFVVNFLNDYFERRNDNFTVHMDGYSPEIHMHAFSLTFLVPPHVIIRGTTIMAAGRFSPKNSVSVPIMNGMSLLIKQFHDNKGELFWHSTPQHDSSPGEREYNDYTFTFHESPIMSARISEEMRRSIYTYTSQIDVRKIIRNTYYTIDPSKLQEYIKYKLDKKTKLFFPSKYSQINNEHLSALTFDQPWLDEIIRFVERVAATMPPPFICQDETHESVDTMVGQVGAILGVGGHNKRSNKRSNKCGNKRRNKRGNKRTKSKRTYKRRK